MATPKATRDPNMQRRQSDRSPAVEDVRNIEETVGGFDPSRPTGWENPRPTGDGEGLHRDRDSTR